MISRARRELDPFLDWKIRIFFAGAVLAAAGILLGYDVLVLLAIIVLLVGLFATTILAKRHARAAEVEMDDEEESPLA
ncbi:MAG TPA: hypothetical protein VFT45_06295 [Longimicrobium sp.]|nr:hypothetical protein [Longimicrobium sp.]